MNSDYLGNPGNELGFPIVENHGVVIFPTPVWRDLSRYPFR